MMETTNPKLTDFFWLIPFIRCYRKCPFIWSYWRFILSLIIQCV